RRAVASDPVSGPRAALGEASGQGALIAMLQHELEIKNRQITQQGELMGKQMELVAGLTERVREGNVLIATLQQRLSLSDGRSPATPTTVDDPSITSTEPKKRSKMA